MLRRLLLILSFPLVWLTPAFAADGAVVTKIKGSYGDLRDSLVAAIEGRGLVISYTAHIAEMLDRTGKDLGAAKRVFDKAETLEFCSAAISRKMMEAAPSNIVNCPYSIAVYTLPAEPGVVYVAYRRPLKGLAAVNELLSGIVADVKR